MPQENSPREVLKQAILKELVAIARREKFYFSKRVFDVQIEPGSTRPAITIGAVEDIDPTIEEATDEMIEGIDSSFVEAIKKSKSPVKWSTVRGTDRNESTLLEAHNWPDMIKFLNENFFSKKNQVDPNIFGKGI